MINTNPNNIKDLYENARHLLESGNFEEAEQKFLEYLRLNQHQFTPKEGREFFFYMTQIYIGLHNYQKARECISFGFTISPDNPGLKSLLKQVITHETMENALNFFTSNAILTDSSTPTDSDAKKKMEYIKILEGHGLTREEIDIKVKEVIQHMNGWIDETTALFVISKELGIELNTNLELDCNEINEE